MNRTPILLYTTTLLAFMAIPATATDNPVLWEKQLTVENLSVVPKPDCSGNVSIEFESLPAQKLKTGALIRPKFTYNSSADDKYFIIGRDNECYASGDYSCITNEALMYRPTTTATLRCYQFNGLMVSIEDGKISFSSDIPEQQAEIAQWEAKQLKQNADGTLSQGGGK